MISSIPNSNHLLHFIFILFHVIFISLTSNDTVFGFTNETDQQALLAVKDLISGDPFSVLSSWNHSVNFCHWRGVTCSRRHQRVTVLDLSSQNLVGSLSPQIGNLTFLKGIFLQNNSFHGVIPQEIGHLYRLRTLALHNNSFQGHFPTNLTRCLDMRVLFLYGNKLGGNIPTELGSLSNLIKLEISQNDFIGQIPPSLGNLSSLKELSLFSNNLVGNIPNKLSLLSNLEYLELSSNNLSDVVPLQLYNISSMQYFGLVANQLQGKLPPDLGSTLPNLKTFLIARNIFSGSFPLSITNASGLLQVDIGENIFTGPLPINFGSVHNLFVLRLYGNQLGINGHPDDLGNLVTSLINCTNLDYLNVGYNGFRGEVPYSIVNLSTTLTKLVLVSNYISGSIPQEIGNLVKMRSLAFCENMFTGTIPKSIGKLSKLEGLYLYTNSISGEIPASVGNISRLSVLNVGDNMLEGSIPVGLDNFESLQHIALYYNRLTGVISEQIVGFLSNIISISLEQNHFSGQLPSNMGSMTNLGSLDVSGNSLTGEIPSNLGNCLMLEYLHMEDNLLQGTIPSSFKQLKSIQVLNLSHNNLSGKIPSFLGDLRLFQVLNLSYNMFVDEVPTNGVFRNISMFSVVGNFQLCGGIQALQLPACHLKDSKKRRKYFPRRLIPLLIILPIIILLICVALLIYRRKRSKLPKPSISLWQDEHPKLSFRNIFQATNGFSLNNLIGEGRYGSVYKGILNPGGEVVAVKVLNVELRGANSSFLAECETLRNIRHRNLLKIITSCSSIDFRGSDFKALVLEFMPKGSLDSWLHPSPYEENDKKLTLLQRLHIAIDVASAVDYLHHHCHTTIVHCDLKPSNILLDEEFVAHVSDFGLARILSDCTSEVVHPHSSSIGIRGTTGYVPPEYGMGMEVSPQGDVYSYGVLLLEMFTGKRPTDNMFLDSEISLCNYVKKALPEKVLKIVDSRIMAESNVPKMEICLTSILQTGILCCVERLRERIDMREILKELTLARNLFVEVSKKQRKIEKQGRETEERKIEKQGRETEEREDATRT